MAGQVLIVACEPAAIEDFEIGLSEPVNEAVDKAVDLIDELLKNIYKETK